MVYDTHAHLDDERLWPDVAGVLERARSQGVDRINCVGCNWKSSLMSVRIAEKYPQQVWAVVGVHPSDAATLDADLLDRLQDLAKAEKVVAWGEIGLDYHYPEPSREVQRRAFVEQLRRARQLGMPVVIHDRDAHQEIVDLLRAEKAGEYGGVLHCFSGSWEMARDCLRLGFYLSFAGPLTYRNARVPVEVAGKAPLERLLVETDCPYLSPEPARGKTNEPSRVVHTLARLAEIQGLDYVEMAAVTTANAQRLFGVA